MSNKSDIDTNINNYTDDELLDIIGLTQTSSKSDIQNRINKIIKKYSDNDEQQYVQFFINTEKKLLSEDEDHDQSEDEHEEISQSEEWLQNQFLRQKNQNQDNKITNRQNTVQILDSTTNPIMHRERLGVSNTLPLEIGQDSLNPTLRQIVSRIITIDSKYRANIVPYSSDPRDITSPTNFSCNLSDKLKNVVKLRLNSIYIPRTWYVYDKYLQNIYFWIKESDENIPPIQVKIPEGNYKDISAINTAINTAIHSKDISAVGCSIVNSDHSPHLHFSIESNYSIIFYKYGLSVDSSNGCVSDLTYATCLGYFLGFRYNTKSNKNTGKIPEYWEIKESTTAHTTPNLLGQQYFNLVIDDYNHNQTNNTSVCIEVTPNKLPLPTYINKVKGDLSANVCVDFTNKSTYVPTFPRKLTQNQLYSINSIIKDRNEGIYRDPTPINSNVLAVIHLPNIDNNTHAITSVNINSHMVYERKYFGPVTIERLKVTLLDDMGNIVNLHGHDWSLTLTAEELYQY